MDDRPCDGQRIEHETERTETELSVINVSPLESDGGMI